MAFTVTATGGGTVIANGILLRVRVLAGAAPAPAQGGATASSKTAYQAAIVTTVTGSIVYGALADNTSFTANGSTTLSDNTPGSAGTQLGSCRATSATGGTPGSVTIGASAPSFVDGGVSLLEVLPNGTITEDASGPAAASSTTLTAVTSASFTPPPGTLLVAMVSSLTATMALTDTSGLGLVWTEKIRITGDGYAGVWVAQMPAAAAQPPQPGGRTWRRQFRRYTVPFPPAPPPLAPTTASGSVALPKPSLAGTAAGGDTTAAGSARLPKAALAAAGTITGAVIPGFPQVPLAITVELLVNGSWTDISAYVLSRDSIVITGGKTNRGDKSQPAQAALTLDNRDGRFSPNYTGGAFYPHLGRNMQLRISVTATSSTGNFYSGRRFWGEVPAWPPLSDISGSDIYVKIVASGPLRRIRAGGGKGSALTRYYAALSGSYAPVAYWPCEEDPDTTILGAGIDGGTDMSVISGTPKWKAVSDFNGSAPIAVVDGSAWDGLTGSFGTSGDDIFAAPGTYTWVASTSSVNAKVWAAGGGSTKGSQGNGGGSPGGGGEFAQETTLAVTPGQGYTVVVGAGGEAGAWNAGGGDGGNSSIAGDSVTVTAHGGKGGSTNGGAGGLGGTGSGNAVHHNGGHGGATGGFNQGAGGGGSGGTAAAGNNGGNSSFGSAGAGAAAVTGGGFGGGGAGSASGDGQPGGSPGGGAGAGFANNSAHSNGTFGASGQVELVYTPTSGGTLPSNNVLRFILMVPKHGGNGGKVLVRAFTSGTVARVDVQYRSGGNLRLLGYDNSAVQLFDSGNLAAGADGQTLMVSAELAASGANVAWAFSAIQPGASGVVAKTSGTVTTAAMGSVTEVLVGPNSDITKTAIGHISVQYALIPLYKVSQALDGHHTEMGIDRFVRLMNEQALDNAVEFAEGADHWGFEGSTQSWAATNCALTSSTVTANTSITTDTLFQSWPPEGSHSLLITASGGGTIKATSPIGTSGQPVIPGDIVSASLEVYTPSAVSGTLTASLDFFNAAGTFLSSASTAFTGGAAQQQTVNLTTGGPGAPAGAAFFAISLVSSASLSAGVLIYADHVRVHTRMGPQTRKEYHKFLEEIEDLDQGIMKEAKELWGLKYRTRFRLINQAPAITLDYSAQQLADPPAPVIDDQKTKNDITVHRHKGSKVRLTLNSGGMSVQEPPAGAGRYRKHLKVTAERDEQLLALANHLLTLGTAADERYPQISVNLARSEVAALMSAIAGAEIGDYVKITNLPFWYPSTTAKQLIIGYTETLSQYQWDIAWNCTPESPLEIVSTLQRRW